MEVYDSNVWIFGLTRNCPEAVALLESVVSGERNVAVSAYIYDEVMLNLDRSEREREVVDRTKTRFAEILHGSPYIDEPTQESIRRMDVDAVRGEPTVRAMGAALDIQAKDVPVLVLAHRYADADRSAGGPVTIRTADRAFSRLDPSEYFPDIRMGYVDCRA